MTASDAGASAGGGEATTDAEPVEVTTLESSRRAVFARFLKDVADRPGRVLRECNRAYHWRLYTRSYNPDGVDVFAADWDTLVVLDACRFDTFAAHHDLPGRLESRTSRGANTYEFLLGNFDGRRLPETVYVTANPRFFRRREDVDTEFHDVVNVWRDGWDERAGTVLPETTTDYALEAAAAYPEKRLAVHYMQPHFPFVGSDVETNEMLDEHNPSVWDLVLSGELDGDAIRRAYVENLEVALPAVERLLDELDGRTVVTADHGNMLGEAASPIPVTEWGHPPGIHTEELLAVPWLVYESGERRRITADATGSADSKADGRVVADRLRQLGYRT